jgi:endonuclease YncB( thermonuclease family)
MFKILRRLFMLLLLVGLFVVGYHIANRPGMFQRIAQTVAEAREWYEGGAEKKIIWQGTGLITRVLDGDTVRMRIENRPETMVRLAGIRAPEMAATAAAASQPLAKESRDYLDRLATNKLVRMQIFATDANKRPWAVLVLNGTNLNLQMVETGQAEIQSDLLDHLPVSLHYALQDAQKAAQQAQRGIWGLTHYQPPAPYQLPHPVPPR